ncbi:hypothetical protein H6P81_001417 [Aristolochia fimbriata]|uniref:Uncharacterized protein n=1 Tax=Aristolochia fimbriata TaxID=158543 RepID=A0AAV7F8G7_ARIFI|nr:hypothetical protein H6P81_001417 [Aristolochia fimbriata]
MSPKIDDETKSIIKPKEEEKKNDSFEDSCRIPSWSAKDITLPRLLFTFSRACIPSEPWAPIKLKKRTRMLQPPSVIDQNPGHLTGILPCTNYKHVVFLSTITGFEVTGLSDRNLTSYLQLTDFFFSSSLLSLSVI